MQGKEGQRMKKFFSCLKLFAVGALFAGLVACGGEGETRIPRESALYLGGSQWDNPSTFNPLIEGWRAAWPVNDRFNLMYEPLLAYNSLNGEFEPLLGKLVSHDTEKVVVDLNPNAKWSDGKPVTSTDVKFVFDLGRRFPSATTSYVTQFVSSIEVGKNEAGDERISFMINREDRNNPLVVLDFLQNIRIVPAHVFEKLLAEHGNSLEEVQKLPIDKDPVVSGPYNIRHYNNQRIILKRRDDYWGNNALYGGKKPAPEFIVHPIYKNNDHFAMALQRGELDASQTFIPRIWLMKNDQVGTWYDERPYFVPGAMPLLLINHTKAPLDDVNFRRAMAAAINYANIKDLAVSEYAPDMRPGLVMSHRLEERFFNAGDAASYGVMYDLDEAKRILSEAGYTSHFRPDGTLSHMTDKDGERIPPLSITVISGWSDWEAMVKIAVTGMRAAGIDVRENPVDGGLYWPALPMGNFDMIITKPADAVTPSLPWRRFEAVMSSRNWEPVATGNMNENQGRYNQPGTPNYNPRVGELLRAIPTMDNDYDRIAAYHELNRIFMKDQVALPLVHMPEQFYQFSTRHWTGWATSANPYAPPLLPWVGASTKVLWKLERAVRN
jgi:peptide/nickel transport system substrate-binding protein